jgi:hypothetical protein
VVENWYCDSSETQHIMLNQKSFVSYPKFAIPEMIVLRKENVLMMSYGQGMINF